MNERNPGRRVREIVVAIVLAALMASADATLGLAHTDYSALMLGSSMVPPTPSSGRGYFDSHFADWNPCPETAAPLGIQAYVQNLEGTPTALSLWIGADGAIGDLYARVPIDSREVLFIHDICLHLRGNMYVVVETDRYPEGEIRGHIIVGKSAPVEDRSWGAIKHLYR